ncbi:MAG: hypothetical protein UFA98_08070 [Ruminococcus sp.]|nr:hypothetical protein [Ruminococcus sp.]
MNEFSLLYPQGTAPGFQTISETACNDLSLEYILSHVAKNEYEKNLIKRMMTGLESRPEVIRYRSDVFDDFISFPPFKDKIRDSLDRLDYLKTLGRSFNDDSVAPIWQLINRLQELDVYIGCIEEIYSALKEIDVRSDGLKQLKDYVASVYNDSGFEYLKADIKELITETSQIQSITLGVNLDETLRPVEVGIVSINKKRFDHSNAFDNFIGFLSQLGSLLDGKSNGNFNGMSKIRSSGATGADNPLMQNLSREVSDMLSANVKHLKSKLSQYVNISGYSLTRLIPDFTFYIRWAEFCEQVIKSGLPMTKPQILDEGSGKLSAKGLYNLKLAIQILDGSQLDVVKNDFEFSKEHGIYIMTGPNRGGKTTFTQAVGLIVFLAQNGLYVPCEALSLSPCDNIFTHFPADENQTVNLGRLGEESKRISEIFSLATENSLLLFNESLATTSFTEGLYIAKDVVKAMRSLGARTIFNTHMHELAMNLEEINAPDGKIKVASLVTGIHEGRRSYKVYCAPPDGISYARDIAEKYGVTYSQLMKMTVERRS